MPAADKILTVRLNANFAQELKDFSSEVQRPRADIVRDAISGYMARERHTIARVKAAMAQADRGETLPHDEAMAQVQTALDRAREARA